MDHLEDSDDVSACAMMRSTSGHAQKIMRCATITATFGGLASFLSPFNLSGFIEQLGVNAVFSISVTQTTQEKKSNTSTVSNNPGEIKFKLTKIGNGRSDDGTWWTEYDIRTSDGHLLHNRYFPFRTVDRANKEFRFFVKNAKRVIEQGPVVDDKGRAIGKRVLALFAEEDEKEKTNYRLFWTSDTLFSEIEGEYSNDLLILESRLKEKPLLEIVKESEP